MTTPDPADRLRGELEGLAAEAMRLGLEVARGAADAEDRSRRVREIDARLDALVPRIDEVEAPDRDALITVWNDARLDVGYVLAGGDAPSSLRLAAQLEQQAD